MATRYISLDLLAYIIDPNEPISSMRFWGDIKRTLSPINICSDCFRRLNVSEKSKSNSN